MDMDIVGELDKGRFWLSGNAHTVFMEKSGYNAKRSKGLFASTLSRILRRHRAELLEVKPAVLVIGYSVQSLGDLGYRPLSNAVKASLRPTTVETWGYGKMKLWWD